MDTSCIYIYEYPTALLNGPFSIDEIAENMRLFFDTDGISQFREIIFLAHSMGGLAVRAYLLKNRDAASRTRLAYYYSTPTNGSEMASLAILVSQNPQLAKMKPMESADFLADQQRQWLAATLNMPSLCAYETQPTYGFKIVTQASASQLCNRRLDPIDANHMTIVKPEGLRDSIYLTFKSAVMQTPGFSEVRDNAIRRSALSIPHEQMLELQGYVSPSSSSTHTAFIDATAPVWPVELVVHVRYGYPPRRPFIIAVEFCSCPVERRLGYHLPLD
jgi:pimeloyl-ACP methyl ester carboxylesterase